MLKHISVIDTETTEILSPSWYLQWQILGDCMVIEGYSIDIIEISGAATEADYYA